MADSQPCACAEDTPSETESLPQCVCPRDDHDIVIHEETCLLFKNEKMVYHRVIYTFIKAWIVSLILFKRLNTTLLRCWSISLVEMVFTIVYSNSYVKIQNIKCDSFS